MKNTVKIEHCTYCNTQSCCGGAAKVQGILDKCRAEILLKYPEMIFKVNEDTSASSKPFPRPGSFEIYFGSRLMFSKISSGQWPEPVEVASKLKARIERQRTGELMERKKIYIPTKKNQHSVVNTTASVGRKSFPGLRSTKLPKLAMNLPNLKMNEPLTSRVSKNFEGSNASIQRRAKANRLNTTHNKKFVYDPELTKTELSSPQTQKYFLKCEDFPETVEEPLPIDSVLNNPSDNNPNQSFSVLMKDREISKTYEVNIDLDSSTNKKITYINKFEKDCTFSIKSSSRNLAIQDQQAVIPAGKRFPFRVTFAPIAVPSEFRYFLLIDRDGEPFETIEIIAKYE